VRGHLRRLAELALEAAVRGLAWALGERAASRVIGRHPRPESVTVQCPLCEGEGTYTVVLHNE